MIVKYIKIIPKIQFIFLKKLLINIDKEFIEVINKFLSLLLINYKELEKVIDNYKENMNNKIEKTIKNSIGK